MNLYPPIHGVQPKWCGRWFELGEKIVPLLSYGENFSGWNDQLTLLHEESTESHHFIDLTSRKHAIQELKQHLINHGQPVLLNVVCSSGYLIAI
jgi:hypothetical protein